MRLSFLSDEIKKRILQDVDEKDLDREVTSAKIEVVYEGENGGVNIESWAYTKNTK
jgi:hypothetical protein